MKPGEFRQTNIEGYFIPIDAQTSLPIVVTFNEMPNGAVPVFSTRTKLEMYMKGRGPYRIGQIVHGGSLIEETRRDGYSVVLDLREEKENGEDVLYWADVLDAKATREN